VVKRLKWTVVPLRRAASRLKRAVIHLLGPKVLVSWGGYTGYRRRATGPYRWSARYVRGRDGSAPVAPVTGTPDGGPAVSLVLLTFNRLRMLERCVSTVLANSGDVDYELIIWDNSSTDGTGEYLDSIAADHARVRIVHNPENIGLNGVAAAVRLARGAYVVELDDDIVDVPNGWLAEMVRSFDAVPHAGYLAADVVQSKTTRGGREPDNHYWTIDYGDGVVVDVGTVGGWCAITSRAVIDRIGNFKEMPGRICFGEDGDFGHRCRRAGLVIGVIRNVKVYHACGPAENAAYGCLDTCLLKYAEDPGNPNFEATKRAMEEARPD
jgi:glycosyltransferase involved in cell wall biosynthesis